MSSEILAHGNSENKIGQSDRKRRIKKRERGKWVKGHEIKTAKAYLYLATPEAVYKLSN